MYGAHASVRTKPNMPKKQETERPIQASVDPNDGRAPLDLPEPELGLPEPDPDPAPPVAPAGALGTNVAEGLDKHEVAALIAAEGVAGTPLWIVALPLKLQD